MNQQDSDPFETTESSASSVTPAPVVLDPTDALMLRIADEQQCRQSRTIDRWMVAIVVLTLGGVCLLISAAAGTKQGMQPWSPNSALRVVVQLMNLNDAYPAPRGVAVKWLAQGVGAAAAILAAVFAWYMRAKSDDERRLREGDRSPVVPPASWCLAQIRPATAAQIALFAFGGWALLSSRWAHFPAGAVAEGSRNAFLILWALSLGRTLRPWGVARAAAGLTLVLVLTAVVGLWYHVERNPVMRLEFPIGNPIFFAACMLPALSLSLAALAGGIERMVQGQRASGAPASPTASEGTVSSRLVLLTVAAAGVLAVVGWAFWLTHSRAPAVALLVALGVGMVAAMVRSASPARRRLIVLGALAVGLLGFMAVGRPYLEAQQSLGAGGRGASLRLRYHTWQYAQDLFFSRPLAGHGQGGFFLLAQQMPYAARDDWGRSDAEKDPTAFAAGLLGHAHSEWLEILADLGAVGFALMATALGLTFWAGTRTYLRTTCAVQKWCLLGMLVGLLAIIVEELADVALRMPVLPVVFYTLIGLIWAMSSNAEPAPRVRSRVPEKLRVVVVLTAILVAMNVISLVRRDWRGALADGQAVIHLEKQQWDDALVSASAALPNRLVLEDFISAATNQVDAAFGGAAHRLEQFRNTSLRAQQAPPAKRSNFMPILEEDAARFDYYLQLLVNSGPQMWEIMPYVHTVAGAVGQSLLMKAELEGRKAQIGLQPEQQPFGSFARRWLGLEYQRNRFDAPAALRLLALAANQPIDDRIELLRIPLRMGPAPLGIQAAFEAAVRQLVAGEPASFAHRMEALLPLAVATTSQPDVNRWPDPYAPETLRLQAMALRAKGDFGQSAALTARAAQMHESEELRARYPTALSCALLDHARAQFLAEPDQPAKAADACRRALELWPDSVDRSMEIQPLQRELSLYLLAGGDEGGAADLLRAQAGPIPEEVMARNVGYGLAEICGRLVERAPSERPAAFQRWLARSVELAPDFPTARWLAAQVALEGGLGAQAVEHLKAVEANLQNPQQFGMMLEAMAKRFPESSELKSYVQARAASAPADDDVDTPTSGPSAR